MVRLLAARQASVAKRILGPLHATKPGSPWESLAGPSLEVSQPKEKLCMPRPRVSCRRKRAVLSGQLIDQRPEEKVLP